MKYGVQKIITVICVTFVQIQFNSIQSLFPYKKYTNIKKHQNNKDTKYGGKDRKANEAWLLSIPEKKK